MLVKIKTAEGKTDGGILVPTTAQTKPQGGEVVATGEGKTVGKSKVDISVKVTFAYSSFWLPIFRWLFTNCFSLYRLAPKLCIPSILGLS